ncbi:MAG: lipid-A-disaccharide synthase, partial [Chloroflexota bacterium]
MPSHATVWFVILPFEQEFYRQYDYEVDFVGHPLLDVVGDIPAAESFRERNGLDNRPIIALLPGSRKQEIERTLEVMLEMVPHFPAYQFAIAGAPAQEKTFYESILRKSGGSATAVKLIA